MSGICMKLYIFDVMEERICGEVLTDGKKRL